MSHACGTPGCDRQAHGSTFAAAGAHAIKATLVDVKTATFQAREPGPLGLDSLLLTSAFHGNRVLRK